MRQDRWQRIVEHRAAARRAQARSGDIASRRGRVVVELDLAPDGSYLHARQPRPATRLRRALVSRRGVVRGLSARSRRRLLGRLALLDHARLPLFITLTFHRLWPEGLACKAVLRAWLQRLRRRWPRAAAVWRLEYQRRGAPHFHLLLWGVPLAARDVLIADWAAVVARATGDDVEMLRLWHTGRLGNQHAVQPVRSWSGVMAYAAKYMAKVGDPLLNYETGEMWTGRVWGMHNAAYLPWHYVRYYLAVRDWRALRRVLRALLLRRGWRSALMMRRDAGAMLWGAGDPLLRWLQAASPVGIIDYRLDNAHLDVDGKMGVTLHGRG